MFLSLESVAVRYAGSRADQPAVEGVSLGLAAGQIGVLIGPSGCGKTTLLRAVAGLEAVHSGRVRMGGQLLDDAGGPDHGGTLPADPQVAVAGRDPDTERLPDDLQVPLARPAEGHALRSVRKVDQQLQRGPAP